MRRTVACRHLTPPFLWERVEILTNESLWRQDNTNLARPVNGNRVGMQEVADSRPELALGHVLLGDGAPQVCVVVARHHEHTAWPEDLGQHLGADDLVLGASHPQHVVVGQKVLDLLGIGFAL